MGDSAGPAAGSGSEAFTRLPAAWQCWEGCIHPAVGIGEAYGDHMTEQQPYTVISVHAGYEVRLYPAHILAQVEAAGSFFEAGNRGFGPLIRYITASNISMTAPVLQAPGATKQYTVSFVMPAGATTVPDPSDASVRTVDVPERRVAARTFSGGSNEKRYQQNADALEAALARDGVAVEGPIYFARYDPPWKPGFLRRNEALVAIR